MRKTEPEDKSHWSSRKVNIVPQEAGATHAVSVIWYPILSCSSQVDSIVPVCNVCASPCEPYFHA